MLVEIDTGIRLDVSVTGDASSEPLLFACGAVQSYPLWDPLVEVLARRYRVICYNHRGIGASERGDDRISIASLADDAASLLKALQIRRAHVCGHSMGTAVAQQLAIAHPDKVGSLVLLNTLAHTDGYADAILTALKYPFVARDLDAVISVIGLAYSPEFLNSPELYAVYKEGMASNPPTEDEFRTSIEQFDACSLHDARDRLGNITAPTLIVGGEQDVITTPSHGRAVAELMPGARLEILTGPGSSHSVAFERFPEVVSLILDFLAEHPVPAVGDHRPAG
jgi:pimeloyl-ACP methyl ester carboxylesterase